MRRGVSGRAAEAHTEAPPGRHAGATFEVLEQRDGAALVQRHSVVLREFVNKK